MLIKSHDESSRTELDDEVHPEKVHQFSLKFQKPGH